MKTLIVGGTFNPVHMGHLFLAEEAQHRGAFERVLFIPSHTPAHKVIDGTTPEQRLAMLELALQGLPFQVETCELFRGGISYSIDTVRCVLDKYRLTGKPTLLLGDDLFETFHTWKDAQELCQLADLLVARRNHATPLISSWPHTVLDNKLVDLSSTEVRERIRSQRAWKSLVPQTVARYIEEHRLYRKEGA